jgi:hypothetical protein
MRKILIAIILVIAIGIIIGAYLFKQKPTDTREIKATFEVSASELIKAFSENEAAANKKYVDQVIIVTGKIGEVKSSETEGSVSLQSDDPMSGVICSFYTDEIKSISEIKSGDPIKIKGKCTGKLMDVVLNACSVVK